jgi:hypothetical protein
MLLRYTLLLCASALALSACSEQRAFIREKYTGERYGAQVTGPRRPPILNPEGVQLNAQVPARIIPQAVPIAPKQAVVPGDAPPSPYDQFDAKGEPTPESYAKRESLTPPPVSGRKPFKGVLTAGNAQAPVLVPQSAPITEEKPQIRPLPVVPDEEDNGVMLPELAPQVQRPPAGVAPRLASVPKVPPEFKALKKAKTDRERELQMNYDAAQEQKKLLSEEPTELPPATLPQVEGMLQDIDGAIHGDVPIVESDTDAAAAGY